MSLITPVLAIPAVAADPGASSRVILSTASLRFTVAGKKAGTRNYTLLRRGEGGVWSKTRLFLTVKGDGDDAEMVVNDELTEGSDLVQGEYWSVLGDPGSDTSGDLVYLSPVGAIIDSSAFYK